MSLFLKNIVPVIACLSRGSSPVNFLTLTLVIISSWFTSNQEYALALLKVVSSKTQLEKAKKLCKKYKYTLLDKTEKSFVCEVSALKKEIDDLIIKLQPLGLASASRTGVVAMTKGSEIYKQN